MKLNAKGASSHGCFCIQECQGEGKEEVLGALTPMGQREFRSLASEGWRVKEPLK